jgi:hypothetical protein
MFITEESPYLERVSICNLALKAQISYIVQISNMEQILFNELCYHKFYGYFFVTLQEGKSAKAKIKSL